MTNAEQDAKENYFERLTEDTPKTFSADDSEELEKAKEVLEEIYRNAKKSADEKAIQIANSKVAKKTYKRSGNN